MRRDQRVKVLRHAFAVALFFFAASSVYGCPCGCGALGPLTLSPGETWKFQFSAGKDLHGQHFDFRGDAGYDGGPQETSTLGLGVARQVSERLSISALAGLESNYHDTAGSHRGLSDPNVGARYTFLSPSPEYPMMPTSQIKVSFKPGLARGPLQDAKKDHQIDLHGNSYSEFLGGLDLWFAKSNWTAGLSGASVYRPSVYVEDDLGRHLHSKGIAIMASSNLAYTWFGYGQVQVNFEREQKGLDKINDTEILNSDSLRYTVAATGSFRLGLQKTLSLVLKRSGHDFSRKNISQSKGMSLNYSQSI